MAKQRFGINDGYRGSVGTVIGYLWRGKWCLRARPRQVRNPRTAAQQLNRLLFKEAVQLAGRMKEVLRKGMNDSALRQHLTACNLFFKNNRPCFTAGADGHLAVDWEALSVSDGALPAPLFGEPDAAAPLVIPFEPCAPGSRASGADEVYVWAWCPAAGEGLLSPAARRNSGHVTLTLPDAWQGKEVHLYGFAVDYKGKASVTIYLGSLEQEEERGESGESGESARTAGVRPSADHQLLEGAAEGCLHMDYVDARGPAAGVEGGAVP